MTSFEGLCYNPEDVLPVMIDVAREVGKIHQKYFSSGSIDFTTKKDLTDLLTKADLDSDSYIREKLSEKFPNAGIISEEGVDKPPQTPGSSEIFFCADPLDGTSNFASGFPHFCVSIGLLDTNWQPLAGVVYDSCRDELFFALKNKGAFFESNNEKKKIVVKQNNQLIQAVVETHFSSEIFSWDPGLKKTTKITKKVRSLRIVGSAALAFCWIASQRMDAMFNPKVCLWDVAAGWSILEEAGGIVTDLCGRPHTRASMNKEKIDMLMATPIIHQLLLNEIIDES